MELSFETASHIQDIANYFLIFALAVGVLATAVIFWTGSIKEDRFKGELAASAKAAADANLKATQLDEEAAIARLETEKIKSSMSWRQLNETQISKLVSALSRQPGSVNIRFVDGDVESKSLAQQMAMVFSKSGWAINFRPLQSSSAIIFGIHLSDSNGKDSQSLHDAFTSTGIRFGTMAFSLGSGRFNTAIVDAPVLMTGSKMQE